MLALIGATCSGKDRIKKELIKLGYDSVVTTTTRPMREGEIQDISYHFIDKSQFRRLKEQGFFAETTSYDTVHGTWYYGTQFKDLKDHENKVIILNPDGINAMIEKEDMSKWLVIYLYCSEEVTKERLLNRGDDPEEAKRRMKTDKEDFKNTDRFFDVKMCNDGYNSPEKMAHIIDSLYKRHIKENT